MQKRHLPAFMTGALFTLALATNCADGTMLDDAGAAEPSVTEAACDQLHVASAPDGTITTTWYARLAMPPGFTPETAPEVSALLCEKECFGTGCDSCPAGSTCTGVAFPYDGLCTTAPVTIHLAEAWIHCGTRIQGAAVNHGMRRKRAFLRVK